MPYSLTHTPRILSFLMFKLTFVDHNREEFDVEKEPDGMILSGWTQAPATENKINTSADNGASTSTQAVQVETTAEEDDELSIIPSLPSSKKRKVSDISGVADDDEKSSKKKVEELDDNGDGDVIMMLDDGNTDTSKKKRLQ